jgi:hypothetical protein
VISVFLVLFTVNVELIVLSGLLVYIKMNVIGYGLVDDGLFIFVIIIYIVGPINAIGVGIVHYIIVFANLARQDNNVFENEPLFK